MKLKASFLCILFSLAFLVVPTSHANAQSPVASFTVSANQACAPANIQFTNTSQNAVSYQWTFGNSNSSSQVNPTNVYAGPGIYTITLTAVSSSGQSSTSSTQITIVAPPNASFTNNLNAACSDYGAIQFQNNSTGYDSCVWDFGDGTTSNLVNPSHTYSVDGVFTVKLMVFNKSLCCSDIEVKNSLITIWPRPGGTITVDTATSCEQNHIFSFSAALSGSPVTGTWNFGDGTTMSSLGNVTKVYTAPGNYRVSLVLQNTFGCVDTLWVNDTIKVKNSPVPVLTRSDSTGCEPLIVYYYCNIPGAIYNWNLGNGSTSSQRNVGLTYANAGSYTPVLTINYQNGCTRTVQMTPTIVKPSPQVSFTRTNGSGCVPLTVSFTNTTAGLNTYMWRFGDGDSSASLNPVHTYTTPGQYIVSLTAMSTTGCSRTVTSGWSPVVASGPVIDFRPDVTSGCSPLTVNFSNYTAGTGNIYLWDFGDGTTSSTQHPVHTYNTNGNYQVSLVVTNSMGCVDTFIYPTSINVSNLSVQNVSPAPIYVCAPYTVYFSDNTAASAWLWDFDDGTTSNLSNPMHTYTQPGVYNVDLTIWMQNGGCSYTITNIQEIHVISTNPGFTWSVNPCPPYNVQFTDTTSGATSWHWNFGDGAVSTQQHPVHSYAQPGTYNVSLTVTGSNGCSATYSSAGGVSFTGIGASPYMTSTDTVAPFFCLFYANTTQATHWLWDFGDGTTSTLENPTHVYTTSGPFSVSLVFGNDSCTYTYTNPPISIGNPSNPGGGFGGGNPPLYVRNVRCAPYSVNFYNPFISASSITWLFGDGTSSNLNDPVHVYADSGSFIPSIIYTISGVTDTMVYSDTFFVAKAPSDFSITYQNTCSGVVVNASVAGSGLTNTWEFGGGTTISGQSATHTYPNSSGNYVIRLSSVDAYGCKSTIAKSFSVNLDNPLSVNKRRGCAGDSIIFSPGNLNFAQYEWNFGDGMLSSLREPVHVYIDSGIFQVALKATDINGCVTWFNMSYTIEIFDPVANFTILQPYGNCDWVFTRVFNASTGSTSYLWNFGDGSYSTDFNMYHYYSQPGFHDITLTATNNVCSSTMVLPHAVFVADLTPGFTYNSTGNCLPSTIQFNDTSIDAVTWHWEFGDGDTSILQNPLHVYTNPPSGPVILTVTDTNGCVMSITDTVLIPTKADYSLSSTGGCSPLTISFADTSYNGVSFVWDFGDGAYDSVNTHPTHTYTGDGNFNAVLSVTGPDGCISQKSTQITVMTPVAAFNADSLNGCAPLMVNFANESSGATLFEWDFGDGDVSGLQHPQHLYSNPGIYTVTLIASNGFGCADTIIYTNYITTRGAVPDFTMSPLSGCLPLTVNFTDLSTNAVLWNWYFGDGTTQNGQNVSHVYSDTGSFTPSLYVQDSTGCTSVFTYPQPVAVNAMPVPLAADNNFSGCSPVTVNYDGSQSQADSLIWDMGDGSVLHNSQINYTYSVPGIYQVRLIVFNTEGCTDTLEFTPVNVYEKPVVSFSTPDTAGCFPYPVTFSNTSVNLNGATYQWNFGNGVTDTNIAPGYVYPDPGIYDITLVVTNNGGCADSVTLNDYISVYDHQPPVEVNWKGVTVNTINEVQLDFIRSPEPDIDHYIIYRKNVQSMLYDSIGVINHRQLTTQDVNWKDLTALPGIRPESYKILAVDICGYKLNVDSISVQTTVHLQTSAGWMKASLQWSTYRGKTPVSYGIFRSVNSTGYIKIATRPNTDSTYVDTTAYCPVDYQYKVVAENLDNNSYNSNSNTSIATPVSNISNQEVSIIRSTVVDNAFTLTEWKAPVLYPWLVSRYKIYRSSDNVHFVLIADVPSVIHEYEDRTVDVQKHEYYYKVTAETECGNSEFSGPGSSIWLQAKENNLRYFLKWTPYTEWDTGVDSYRIEKLDDQGLWQKFRTVNGTITEVEEK